MSVQVKSIALDPISADLTGADDGQFWYRSVLGEPRIQRQGAPQTVLTPPSHGSLDDLAHQIAESGVTEDTFNADGCIESRTIRSAPSPSGVAIRTWDSYTFDADGCTSGYRVRQFNGGGAVVQTLTVSRPGGVWTSVLS